MNAARARGYYGRSASSRGFRCHGCAHSLTDRKLGRMVPKMGCGGRTGSETRKTVSDTRHGPQARTRASCTRSRRGVLPTKAAGWLAGRRRGERAQSGLKLGQDHPS